MTIYAEIEKRLITIGGEQHRGWLPENTSTPPLTPVKTLTCHFRITDDGGDEGALLIYESEGATYSGDTWHGSLEDATAAAKDWFNIDKEEWNFIARDSA